MRSPQLWYLPAVLLLASCSRQYSRLAPAIPSHAPYLKGAGSFEATASAQIALTSGRMGGSYLPVYAADGAYSPRNHFGIRSSYRRTSNYTEVNSTTSSYGELQTFNGAEWLAGAGVYKDVTPSLYAALYAGIGAGNMHRRGGGDSNHTWPFPSPQRDFDIRYQYLWFEPSLTSPDSKRNQSALGFRYLKRRYTYLYRPYQSSSENILAGEFPYRLDVFVSWTHAFSPRLFCQFRLAVVATNEPGNRPDDGIRGSDLGIAIGTVLGLR